MLPGSVTNGEGVVGEGADGGVEVGATWIGAGALMGAAVRFGGGVAAADRDCTAGDVF